MEIHLQHERDVRKICKQLQFLKNAQTQVIIDHGTHLSHTTRENKYRKFCASIDFSELSRVISVDPISKVAFVEPEVTMEQLVKATLLYGLIPPIIPEFKRITVGGAIMGSALESGSHQYGQFNDICSAFEILLGDCSVVRATKDNHPDLFYGICGSYGSIGALLGAEVKLVPARHYVNVTYHRVHQISEAIQWLLEIHKQTYPPKFLEGIVYSNDEIILIEGGLSSLEFRFPKQAYTKSSSQWFYHHVKETKNKQETIPLEDYLFRHDRATFWMGCYAIRFPFFARFLLSKMGINIPISQRLREKLQHLCYPSYLTRICYGWMTSSHLLYKLLHSVGEEWLSENLIIQDFYIPATHASDFIETVIKKYGIQPLWLCPILSTSTPQLFSPHYQPALARISHKISDEGGRDIAIDLPPIGREHCPSDKARPIRGEDGVTDCSDSPRVCEKSGLAQTLLINVGIYGIPKLQKKASEITKELETLCLSCGGKKMLYGYSYYSPEEFWKIYPREEYLKLRRSCHAEGVWVSTEKKVLNPDFLQNLG